jgi:hypothetical protein
MIAYFIGGPKNGQITVFTDPPMSTDLIRLPIAYVKSSPRYAIYAPILHLGERVTYYLFQMMAD